jgi:hypothetical protein
MPMNENCVNKTSSKAQIMEYAFVTFKLLFKGVASMFLFWVDFLSQNKNKMVIFKDYFCHFSTIFKHRHF